MNLENEHDLRILDQFTRQAAPFAERHRADQPLLDLLIRSSGVRAGDRVLDVACGPGIVACALAPHAAHVTGLDFTPAMLKEAAILQDEHGLRNVDWRQGSATQLPFDDMTFDLVVTRFSFHHYCDPQAAFREMVRVTRRGGRILVVDVAPRPEAQKAYDTWEKHRDPSHIRALTEPEFEQLGIGAGVLLRLKERFDLASDVDGLLRSSFPPAGGAEAFCRSIEMEVEAGSDGLGIQAHRRSGALWFYFPVLVALWERADVPER
jgi:SAM-dependent methyltransferase